MTSGACRIAQFSDLHLSSASGGLSKGVDCWDQLCKMLEHLSCQRSVDGIVFTGDIAHDESRESYERLRTILNEQDLPYWLVPGNHDDPGLMRDVFSERLSLNNPTMCFCTVLRDTVVIGLDTHEPGSDGGRLSPESLAWFKKKCSEHSGRSIIVFMHHPPLNTEDSFFDLIGLAERESFWETIKQHSQIKAVGFGHLHRSLKLNRDPWVQGAPSASFAMERTSNGWDIRPEGAGYLVWTVNQGDVTTEVLGQG